ncbi:MAG: hypothetical protein ACXW1D_00290 [Halobacteriota archaeon]
MNKPSVTATAEHIEQMALVAENLAKDLRYTAVMMRHTNNLEYASDAIMNVTSALQNIRLDLLVTKPLRELSK